MPTVLLLAGLCLSRAGLLAQSDALAEVARQAKALYEAGELEAALPVASEALRLSEGEFGSEHPATAIFVENLARIYFVLGQFARAEPLYARALALRVHLGPEHPSVANAAHNLAIVYLRQGRYAKAEPLLREALGIWQRIGTQDRVVAAGLNSLALLYQSQGRYAEAEPHYRRVLEILEASSGREHPEEVATALGNLAALYVSLGRYAEAEALFERALSLGDKPVLLNNLALLHQRTERHAEAVELYQRALSIAEKEFGGEHPHVATVLGGLAQAYFALGRYTEAESLHFRALAIEVKALTPEHPAVAASLNNLGLLLESQDRYSEAEMLFRRSLLIAELAFGAEHPDVAMILDNVARLCLLDDRLTEALTHMRRATGIHRTRGDRAAGTWSGAALVEQAKVRDLFLRHVEYLARALATDPQRDRQAVAEAFEVAQLAQATEVATAVARMAARFAAGDDGLAEVVRARQDAAERWRGLDQRLVRSLSALPAERDREREARLRADLESLAAEITALDERLALSFPDYAELAHPSPASLGEIQRLLAAGEALIAYLVSPEATYLLVVRADDAALHRLDLAAEELADVVGTLRQGLDQPGVARVESLRRYRVEEAWALYRKLLAPAEPLLEGVSHLFVVPDGALRSLPFGVLVTAEPESRIRELAAYREIRWLAAERAVTTLPTVASLRALRRVARPSRAGRPFVGFGDPDLESAPVEAVRRLDPLDDTADELAALARVQGAEPSALFLGPRATEGHLRSIPLADYRVLAFATHGLLAGELPGVAEPALVLTPPTGTAAGDDGLLTASEIATLELDADWVILSACNTAAAATPGAEGLSGLAKAFFYAGARALLVSHWSVESSAAVALTTRALAELAAHPGIGRAEALRRSMLSLIADEETEYFAHPAFWAPFVVVGEGG